MITAKELNQQLSTISIGANTCNFSMETCEKYAPIINQINELKKEKNAIILAKSYMALPIMLGIRLN